MQQTVQQQLRMLVPLMQRSSLRQQWERSHRLISWTMTKPLQELSRVCTLVLDGFLLPSSVSGNSHVLILCESRMGLRVGAQCVNPKSSSQWVVSTLMM